MECHTLIRVSTDRYEYDRNYVAYVLYAYETKGRKKWVKNENEEGIAL